MRSGLRMASGALAVQASNSRTSACNLFLFYPFSVDSLSFSEDLDRLRQEVRRLSVQVEIAERECGEEARPHSASLFWQYQSAMLLRADIKRIILTILNIHFSCFSTGRGVLDFLALKHWNGRQTDSTNKARTPWLWPQVDRWHNMAKIYCCTPQWKKKSKRN